MTLYPAVVIGGPPDSGKSVLTYHLSQQLRQRGVQHYVLRANPDGEGDWANESDRELVRSILAPRPWSPAFVDHVCRGLEKRHLPLLVDMGGRPADWQEAIFDHCTHAILLTPAEDSQAEWLALAQRHNLRLLAVLRSVPAGAEPPSGQASENSKGSEILSLRVTAASGQSAEASLPKTPNGVEPHLTGVIAGLEWNRPLVSPTFTTLLDRLARLFAYDPDHLRRSHLLAAPVETAVDLDRLAVSLGVPFQGQKATWQPGHLPALLDYLPAGKPLGLYGRGPNWLYAAAALHAHPASFYQFDPRLGWVAPPQLAFGPPDPTGPLQWQQRPAGRALEYTFYLSQAFLDYDDSLHLTVPPLPTSRRLILAGKLPFWLYTGLALAYHAAPVLALYQPQLGRVVVASRRLTYPVGSLLADE
jgi:CRISPR-associated protein Csx3